MRFRVGTSNWSQKSIAHGILHYQVEFGSLENCGVPIDIRNGHFHSFLRNSTYDRIESKNRTNVHTGRPCAVSNTTYPNPCHKVQNHEFLHAWPRISSDHKFLHRKDPNLPTPSIQNSKTIVEIEERLHFDRCPDEFSWKSRSATIPCSQKVVGVKL